MNVLGAFETNAAVVRRPEHVSTDECQVLESKRELLQLVWEETAPELSRLIQAMTVPADRVEDVLQDIYLASWQKPPADVDHATLRRWLFRVAVNRCHLEHRRRQRWRAVWSAVVRLWPGAGGEPRHGRASDAAAEHDENQQLVRAALQALAPDLRAVLTLRYFSDFNSKEIGKILHLPDTTVRSRLRRGRRMLADQLRRAGFGDE